MAWVRIDEHFPDHPKIVAAGEAAAYLYVAGLCYCNRLLTNGFIPLSQVERLVPFRQEHELSDSPQSRARRLCDLHLWADGERKGVVGFVIHDYLKYQPSKKQVTEARAKTAARQGRFRHASGNGGSNGGSNGVSNAPVTPVPIPIPIPIPKEETKSGGGNRPLIRNEKFAIHRWMIDQLIADLGTHVDVFDLDEWLMMTIPVKAAQETGLVENWWKWLQTQTFTEAKRRGIPVAGNGPPAKRTSDVKTYAEMENERYRVHVLGEKR